MLFGVKKPKTFEDFVENLTNDEGASYIEYALKKSRDVSLSGKKYVLETYNDPYGKTPLDYAVYFAERGSGDAAFYAQMLYAFECFWKQNDEECGNAIVHKYMDLAKKNGSVLAAAYTDFVVFSVSKRIMKDCFTAREIALYELIENSEFFNNYSINRKYDKNKWKAKKFFTLFNTVEERILNLAFVLVTNLGADDDSPYAMYMFLKGAAFGYKKFNLGYENTDKIQKHYIKKIKSMAKNGDERAVNICIALDIKMF